MGLFGTLDAWISKRARKMEESRFGILTMYNALQSCVGSVAVMKVQQHNAGMFLLAVVTVLTIASNSVFIAQGSLKLCLLLFYLSILANTVIIFSLVLMEGGFECF